LHSGVLALLVAVLGLAGWIGGRTAGWFGTVAEPTLRGAPVRRGPLRISTVVGGSLQSADSVSLVCELEGRTTILSLAPEGSSVKAGDIVCELDASLLVETRLQKSIEVSNADAALVKARQGLQIQESQNRSDIAAAEQSKSFGEQDLRKFLEGERDALLAKARQTIDIAREEATRTTDRLGWSQKLFEGGFLTTTELEGDRIAQHRAQVELEQAVLELDLLERFTLPRQESQLRATLAEAEREMERVQLQAKAHLVDYEAGERNAAARLELEREQLARIESQIAKAQIRAPRDGMLVYRQFDEDELPIQEGREVRERQTLMYIPSAEGMIAEAKVHESVLDQIKVGQRCTLTVDALRGSTLEGAVSFVALLPDQGSWWSNPNTRVYRIEVDITSPEVGLRPGMSCSIEILIDELPDALHVPVQTVFRSGDVNLCYVATAAGAEPREVRVGRFNDLWVEILDGLAEGETVLLTPPADAQATRALGPPKDEELEEDGDEKPQAREEQDEENDEDDERGGREERGERNERGGERETREEPQVPPSTEAPPPAEAPN
jgi:HlyD family secretion protein